MRERRKPLLAVFWAGAVFSYFFQFPIKRLSSLIVPFLAVFIILALFSGVKIKVGKRWRMVYGIYLVYLLLMVLFSAMEGTEITTIIRFLLILVMIPLFCIARPGDFSLEKSIFIILAVLKCLLLLYYAVMIYRAGSFVEYREWAQANDYGDMYINPTTHLPGIMVQGNGILPVAFILNFEDPKIGAIKKRIFGLILLSGMIVAGNMAFLLAVAVYFGIKLLKYISESGISKAKQLVLGILLVAAVFGFLPIGIRILSTKADYSNAVRILQAQILLQNYFIVGNGIGHKIFADIGFRVYAGDTYFELQTLYIYNQIGITGIIMFYYLVFSPFHRTEKTNLYLFIAYIAYSFWNPYCFDSTEMMVLMLLLNYPLGKRREWVLLPGQLALPLRI